MGYYLNAFIGHSTDLRCISELYSEAMAIELTQHLSLIPLTEELFDQLTEFDTTAKIGDFEYLTSKIELNFLKVIKEKSVAYVEVNYFGGQGGQTGIIWKDGKRNVELAYGQEAVNIILRAFGVISEPDKDEFDTLALGRYRHTHDWANSTS